MSNSVTITAANEFFSAHLDRSFWAGLDDDTKTAVLTMAERDVLAKLDMAEFPTDNQPVADAVCEQAVYLARNYTELTEGKVVTSENIDGISTGYTIAAADIHLSPRAVTLIDRIKRAWRRGSVPIGRG